MRLTLLLLAALPGLALAQAPADFAWQWPLQVPGQESAYRIELDEATYARIARDDLRDLMVFNADGQAVPFSALPDAPTTREARRALNWLRVPVAATGGGDDTLSLRLERDADGRVRELQLDDGTVPATSPGSDLLVDLGEDPSAVSAIRLQLAADAAMPVNLRVSVLGSDDLAQWQVLGQDLAVVAIVDNGLRVERLRLEFAPSSTRYLRLRLAEGEAWPSLGGLEQETVETGRLRSPRREIVLQGRDVPDEPGAYDYTSPGPIPVERVDLRLPAANSVASVQVESRTGADGSWTPIAALTAFRLGEGDEEVRHLPTDIDSRRDRQWRLRVQPVPVQAPTLVLSYRPDNFVMLAQGPAPYRLMAGSVRTMRPDYPVQAALAASGKNRPAGWQPALATLGTGGAGDGGDAVLQPDRGPEHRRWLLWAVLVIGAALVLAMSLRVLRAPGKPTE
ncbi:DUF3999 domain-containing protein [Arenimonas sp. MALMAid1274]|uniref:DUF3999 domain-containing protein n=1 Tax=Arenimonas sp. MALMAid1274 TaxID=3411630 RepID=UPI003B9F3492